jgi:hypothetical protein
MSAKVTVKDSFEKSIAVRLSIVLFIDINKLENVGEMRV